MLNRAKVHAARIAGLTEDETQRSYWLHPLHLPGSCERIKNTKEYEEHQKQMRYPETLPLFLEIIPTCSNLVWCSSCSSYSLCSLVLDFFTSQHRLKRCHLLQIDSKITRDGARVIFPGFVGVACIAMFYAVVQVEIGSGAQALVVQARQPQRLFQILLEIV
jgi:hypothetical protein